MADQRDYPNSGTLWRNDRKVEERDRDHKGDGRLDCPHCGARIELWLSAWNKTARTGAQFLSLSFRPKDPSAAPLPREEPKATTSKPAEVHDGEEEDDIPF